MRCEMESNEVQGLESLKLHSFFFEDDIAVNKLSGKKDFSYLNEGKHLRARLVKGLAEAFEIPEEKSCIVARSVELIHNATLTHDDVIDNSFYRRGSETLNKSLNNKSAVLLGDYQLAKSLCELSVLDNHKIMKEVSFCLKRLVDGELFQMSADNPYTISFFNYENLAKEKTGSLFVASLTCVYHLLPVESEQLFEQLKKIGNLLGLIFQMQDDILDFKESLNKTPYLDFKNNNPNVVMSLLGERLSTSDHEILMNQPHFDIIDERYKNMFNDSIFDCEKYLKSLIDKFEDHINEMGELKMNELAKTKTKEFFNLIIKKLSERTNQYDS